MITLSSIEWAAVVYLCIGCIRAIVLYCKLRWHPKNLEEAQVDLKGSLPRFILVGIFWPFSFTFRADFMDEDEMR